jgi:hypothetical protein
MKILLGDFNAKVGREDIFKLTIGNESLHEINNDNVAKLHWLQDPSEINGDKVRLEPSRHFRNKKREYLKAKINELATNNKKEHERPV